MREHYIEKIEELKNNLIILENQFNAISGININNKIIDVIINRMRAIEIMIDSVYIQAKVNNVVLN